MRILLHRYRQLEGVHEEKRISPLRRLPRQLPYRQRHSNLHTIDHLQHTQGQSNAKQNLWSETHLIADLVWRSNQSVPAFGM
jgi:hypothetical protein